MEPLPPPSSLRNLGVSQSTNDLVTYEWVCAGRVFCVLPESLLKWQFGVFQLCPEVPVKNSYDTITGLICISAVFEKQIMLQLWD